ncbi:hypothetical protein BZM27_49140 [Paraburkholderia steynii]|uniref:NAD(P)-binding domain-containing protein n=1 Tax=Paraburkholderia steynii TaxID=1245441 RepID=A0A4R0X7B8_9BURK|nr:hypothetical protein BZM27_49140 [Paraburkholderia steynii]
MSKTLKIALFGATGMIGSRIAAEAVRRGHQVTAFSRNPERAPADVANLKAAQADVTDAASIAAGARGEMSSRAPMRRRRTISRRSTRRPVRSLEGNAAQRVSNVSSWWAAPVRSKWRPASNWSTRKAFRPPTSRIRARARDVAAHPACRQRSRLDVLRARRADRSGRAQRHVPHGRQRADRRCAGQQQHFGGRLRNCVRRRAGAGPFRSSARDCRILKASKRRRAPRIAARGAQERLSRRRASALTFGYASGSFPSTTPAKLGVSRSHADCLHKSHGLP